ncbi:MAG: hypothetical protein P0S95_05290 [Rhabdochlamydiaceae bacterium]|nr:hypothetical protein [Candidatus Amphrikana amoebophyrae]
MVTSISNAVINYTQANVPKFIHEHATAVVSAIALGALTILGSLYKNCHTQLKNLQASIQKSQTALPRPLILKELQDTINEFNNRGLTERVRAVKLVEFQHNGELYRVVTEFKPKGIFYQTDPHDTNQELPQEKITTYKRHGIFPELGTPYEIKRNLIYTNINIKVYCKEEDFQAIKKRIYDEESQLLTIAEEILITRQEPTRDIYLNDHYISRKSFAAEGAYD